MTGLKLFIKELVTKWCSVLCYQVFYCYQR